MSEQKAVSTKKRYFEIDTIKFLAIIFMIFVHTYEFNTYELFFDSPAYENPFYYSLNYIIEFLGGAPAAPVFMFCMGLGLTFSKSTTPAKLVKRAGQLVLVGLLVNFLEEILWMVWDCDFSEILGAWPGLFANDVYFFFALTFLFFAFAYAVKAPVIVSAITGIACLIGGFFLPYIDFCKESTAANLLLGLFVRTDEYAFFPFTSWIIFPIAGFLFGKILTKAENKGKLYLRSSVISAVVLGAATFIGYFLGYENSMVNALDCEDADYYAPNFFSQTWAVAFVILWIGIFYLLTKKMKEGKVKDFVIWGSRNVMPIYVLQWLVIAILNPFICLSDNIFFTYGVCLIVTILTILAAKVYLSIKAKVNKKSAS